MQTTVNFAEIIGPAIDKTEHRLLINGQWQPAANGATFPVTNPATGETLRQIADGGVADTRAAIDAAAAAFPGWAATSPQTRADLLRKVAALMVERREYLATVMTAEQGKPMNEARGEITYSASFFNWFAGEAERIYGQVIPSFSTNKRILVLNQPVGIAVLITPWNFPAGMLARKLAPALAAGCTVICKPAEQTPLTALEMGKICVEAGFPAGVVNIITCNDPIPFSETVFADERVRKLSFTGSIEVGKKLITQSASTVKRLSLELGGNAPFIVFGDADLSAAVQGAMLAKFRNGGQTCLSANRVFVQRSIYEQFAAAYTAEAAKLKVGNGLQPETTVGPLIDMQARTKVERHVTDATAHGAQVLLGGKPWAEHDGNSGTFWMPTILGGASTNMLVAQEETFGPVAPLIPFDDEDEVIAKANDTLYGLAAYFYTRDVSRVMRVAERLEYGIIGVNDGMPSTAQTPFGGFKHSGLGREAGPVGIDEYLEMKTVSIVI